MSSVSNAVELRNEIQAALPADNIEFLNNIDSVLTLAKLSSFNPPATPFSGYTIDGNSNSITNTRFYQQNIDGPYAPRAVKDLDFIFNSGGAADGSAILSATAGTYLFENLTFSGQSRGWDSNGNLYMSVRSFSHLNPIDVDFQILNSNIELDGQLGFDPLSGAGGSAFLHSWNNNGEVSLANNIFDESGYLSSFNFLNTGPGLVGVINITSNIFTRSLNPDVVREQGNLLVNVSAAIEDNTFERGSYLDLYALNQVITIVDNSFETIEGGYGIRITGPSVPIVPTLLGTNVFFGNGLPLKYVDSADNKFVSLQGSVIINGTPFDKVTAGGQGSDVINLVSGFADWAYGDDGNDSISGGDQADLLIGGRGFDTLEGGSADDFLRGNTGNDSLHGNDGEDTLIGGGGSDTVIGGIGNDVVNGDNGNDTVVGARGNDVVNGGNGNDLLQGGKDNDSLNGGNGIDTLIGAQGMDTYIFDSVLGPTNVDSITDMVLTGLSTDTISLDNDIFVGLTPGALPTANFIANATGTPVGMGPQVVYDTSGPDAGSLYWAPNGSVGSSTLFAILGNAPAGLSEVSFVVVD